MTDEYTIGIFIDSENISHKVLPRIIKEASRYGRIVLCAVYGDWEQPSLENWHQIATENNLQIRHQSSDPNTKNSSDMKLIMDAMEVLYHHISVDIFCLVSNDADYVPLCDKLHEAQKSVIGIGYKNASSKFIRSCDHFVFVTLSEPPLPVPDDTTVLIEPEPSLPASVETAFPVAPKLRNPRNLLRKAFAKSSENNDSWVSLSTLGMVLREVQSDFSSNQYGHATLSNLLESFPDLIEVKTDGSTALARLINKNASKPLISKELRSVMTTAFKQAEADKLGWVNLSSLGSTLQKVQPGFSPKKYGHAQLYKLLKNMPDFIEYRDKNGVKSARLKS